MPNAVQFPTGDSAHGHTSVELTLDAVIMTGITQISYGDNLEWGSVGDTRGFEVAKVRGEYKADEIELTILFAHWQAWLAQAPADWRTRAFPISVHRRTPGLQSYTDRITGCRFMKLGTESAQGSDGHTIRVSFSAKAVFWSEKAPLPGMTP